MDRTCRSNSYGWNLAKRMEWFQLAALFSSTYTFSATTSPGKPSVYRLDVYP